MEKISLCATFEPKQFVIASHRHVRKLTLSCVALSLKKMGKFTRMSLISLDESSFPTKEKIFFGKKKCFSMCCVLLTRYIIYMYIYIIYILYIYMYIYVDSPYWKLWAAVRAYCYIAVLVQIDSNMIFYSKKQLY